MWTHVFDVKDEKHKYKHKLLFVYKWTPQGPFKTCLSSLPRSDLDNDSEKTCWLYLDGSFYRKCFCFLFFLYFTV